jgi:DNA polymerase bacteriophage-type
MKLTIDFEIKSVIDIKKHGPWVYAENPLTEPLCLAVKVDNRPPRIWIRSSIYTIFNKAGVRHNLPTLTANEVNDLIKRADTVEAHNAFFERCIWKRIMVPRLGWPDIPDHKWRCSMTKASAHALPRTLKMAGVALNLPIQKDDVGHTLMLKMCKPRRPRKDEDPAGLYWYEDPADFIRLFQYCLQDVESEYALSEALDDLNPLEQKVWFLDQKINERGIMADVDTARKIIEIVNLHEARLLEELSALTEGNVQTAKQVAKMAEFCGTANMKKETVTVALESESNPVKKRVLEIRQSLGRSSVSKYQSIIAKAAKDKRIRGELLYHGATTGRWTGRGVQLQNLPRECIESEYLDLALELVNA